jgi:hypothetical protein
MDWKRLAGQVAGIAEEVLPVVVPGAGPAILVAEKVVALGKEVMAHAPASHEATSLTVSIDQLEHMVMEHADRTIASLGDGPT